MKYMRWSDLEPGDVLQFTDEYLNYRGDIFTKEYKDKNLIIKNLNFFDHIIVIYLTDFSRWMIFYNGFHMCDIKLFKLIRLKDK